MRFFRSKRIGDKLEDSVIKNSITMPANALEISKFFALLGLQTEEGSFPLTEGLCSVIGIDLNLLTLEAKSHRWDLNAWGTVLAMTYARIKLATLKPRMNKQYDLARLWVFKNHGSIQGAMEVVAEARISSIPNW